MTWRFGWRLAAAACVASTTDRVCAAQAAPEPATIPWTLSRMSLDLTLDYGRQTVAGFSTLVLRNTSSRPAARVPLLLNRLMSASQIADRAGTPLPFDQRIRQFEDDSVWQVAAIAIDLPRPVAPGDSTVVTTRYAGILVGYAETGALYIRDHVSREFTILREDALAFPRLGVPSWRAMRSFERAPFAFDLRLHVPPDLVVAAGGVFVDSVRRDSIVVWRYRSDEPVPFLNVAVAPYRVIDRGAAKLFFLPPDSTGARQVHDATEVALERLRAMYGPTDRRHPLTVIEIPDGFGSQASLAGGIIQTADAFKDARELRQVYHELTHLWNPPDLDHPSSRWNEGLASFLQWRLAESLDGSVQLSSEMDRTAKSLLRRCSAACAAVPLADYGEHGMTDLSYPVGQLMFGALYQVFGADQFDRRYGAFFQSHRASGARLADLVSAFDADPRASRIFDEWLRSTRWYARLRDGETFAQIAASYRE